MLIDILGHTFIESEIVGVSPLFIKSGGTDQATEMVYKPRTPMFKLFLKQQTVEIAGDQIPYATDKELFQKEYAKLMEARLSVVGSLMKREE